MRDRIFENFLNRQHRDGTALAAASDLLDVQPVGPEPVRRYLATFHCRGLVQEGPGRIEVAEHFEVGIQFPAEYLRRVTPPQVLRLFSPQKVWHPNVSAHGPFICVGRLTPGTALVDLLYQVFEILTYNKVTMREDDALNLEACSWARRNLERFPLDRRPLKRHGGSAAVEARA